MKTSALLRWMRGSTPPLPGVAAFLSLPDLISLLSVLERKSALGREEIAFQPESSRLMERLISASVEQKNVANAAVSGVTYRSYGSDVTRRKLNLVHDAIVAIPFEFPPNLISTTVPPLQLSITYRADEKACEFTLEEPNVGTIVIAASCCSGEGCKMISLLTCMCCGETLGACQACAIPCVNTVYFNGCKNVMICRKCALDASEITGFGVGCRDCFFRCITCKSTRDHDERVRCNKEACLRALSGETCLFCEEVESAACSVCKLHACSGCEQMWQCESCEELRCLSCVAQHGQEQEACDTCHAQYCSAHGAWDGGVVACGLCNVKKCHDCEGNQYHQCSTCLILRCRGCEVMTECGANCQAAVCGSCDDEGWAVCSTCADDKCPDCVRKFFVCAGCSREQCSGCTVDIPCEQCNKRFCRDCLTRCCHSNCNAWSDGGGYVCKQCTEPFPMTECSKCKAWECESCSDCGDYFSTCYRCDKLFCYYCFQGRGLHKYCPICKEFPCNDCHAKGCVARAAVADDNPSSS